MAAVREQKKASAVTGYETTIPLAFDNNVKAGSLLIAIIKCDAAIVSITDNQGNTWNKISSAVANYGGVGEFWYAYNATAGATTVTASTAPSYSDFCMVIAEYSGVLSSGDPLDVNTFTDETAYLATHATGNTSVPTEDNQLVVAGITGDLTAVTVTSSDFSNVTQAVGSDTYSFAALGDKDMVTAAAQGGNFSTGVGNYTNGFTCIATFKLAPAANTRRYSLPLLNVG